MRPVRLWRAAFDRRRWARRLGRWPRGARVLAAAVALAAVVLAANWVYQVARKPSELLFPLGGSLAKRPADTWRQYGAAFERYSTRLISPELLAALAQVEASGNPVARTYWRWSWQLDPFEMYRPASSAVGLYQLTDGTFADARRYCIRDHVVVADAVVKAGESCWLSRYYARVIPTESIEMTSAYLDRAVAATLARHRLIHTSAVQEEELATVIHLCGAGAGDRFARRRFRIPSGERCGDHDLRAYVARVAAMETLFARLRSGRAAPPG